MSKPARSARSAAATKSAITASMSARVISRGTWLCGIVGQRRGRDDRPGALAAAAGPCPPTSAWSRPCGRRGRAAGRTSCRIGVHEIDDALPGAPPARRRRCPAQPGEMRASGETQVISVNTGRRRRWRASRSARGASRSACRRRAEYWHIGETTTRFSSVMPRSRNGWNIGASGFAASTSKPDAADVARNHRSISATNSGARSARLS